MASKVLFDGIPPFPGDVPTAAMATVPLELLRDGNDEIEKNILTASTDFGFFLLDIRGDSTGSVLIREIDALFSLCQEVMNLPADVKSQHEHDFPRSFLGFKPLGQAKTEKGEPDRYESFNFGQDGLMEIQPLQSLPPMVYDRLPLVRSYLTHCQEIVALLNKALARQLKLPEDTFSALQSPKKPSGTMIRLLKAYASPEDEDLRTALVQHTDFGTITLLANVLGGLQILRPGGSPEDKSAWLWARPLPGHCMCICSYSEYRLLV
ncbi:hypothetical protein F4808DRAFT_407653 [Astrocystis sublimbata]|nr:hypothetical protein F4808DRAFT_407653 [Astrocystis sublimbata]